MAVENVYKIRWHVIETVTATGAFVRNHDADQQGLFMAADVPTAIGLVPAAAAPLDATHTNTNVIDQASNMCQSVAEA